MLGRRYVAVCDDEDTGNGDCDGDDFACLHFFMENRDAEGVCEEGAAVVDCGQVGGGGLVHGDVPAAAGEGEGAGNEGGHLDHVADGRDLLLTGCRVEGLVLHGECDLAQ